jgi:hypothetical protein
VPLTVDAAGTCQRAIRFAKSGDALNDRPITALPARCRVIADGKRQ